MSGLASTYLYLPFPVMLLGGAAVAGRWPRLGRWLMGISAFVLSVTLLPSFLVLLPEFHFVYVDLPILLIDIGWIGTVIMLPLCDVMLLVDRVRRRKAV
jgi:hypothetical protein